ncbi:MAG TPA: vitamin B12 dependent-methionine synthase activation domain-containing protein, partial [Wenzhouxiangella sp.]
QADYLEIRERAAQKKSKKPLIALAKARDNAKPIDWSGYTPPSPKQLGHHVIEWPLADLVRYIDWTPFFRTWELAGRYPDILDDPIVGEAARPLWADAQAMLKQIVDENWLQAKAVCSLMPANADGDDIVIYEDEDRSTERERFVGLRQQADKPSANLCLSDFVAPIDSGKKDYVGCFAVTTGLGIEAAQAKLPKDDDYADIMLKALADRLAEALAEALHEKVRRELWGYAPKEGFSPEALIAEEYQGIRPAPGYPACPDHSEKTKIFDLLDAANAVGITLTENFAMWPTAAVSGYYFSHPESQYFVVGKIGQDQLEDYAQRKGVDLDRAAVFLRPNLSD